MSPTDAWPAPIPIPALSKPTNEQSPHLSADKLTIYFHSSLNDPNNPNNLFTSTRASLTAPFGAPVPIAELNTGADETDPWVSPDGHHIFFMRGGAGTVQGTLWEATR